MRPLAFLTAALPAGAVKSDGVVADRMLRHRARFFHDGLLRSHLEVGNPAATFADEMVMGLDDRVETLDSVAEDSAPHAPFFHEDADIAVEVAYAQGEELLPEGLVHLEGRRVAVTRPDIIVDSLALSAFPSHRI